MSFDVFLVTFSEGEKGKADVAAAREVLRLHRYTFDPKHGAYDLTFEDRSSVEMYARGLEEDGADFHSAMFAIRGLTPPIAKCMFDFARAAGSVLFPAMEPSCVLVPRTGLELDLPKDLNKSFRVIQVQNHLELLAALQGGYESWSAYRDHLHPSPDSDPH